MKRRFRACLLLLLTPSTALGQPREVYLSCGAKKNTGGSLADIQKEILK